MSDVQIEPSLQVTRKTLLMAHEGLDELIQWSFEEDVWITSQRSQVDLNRRIIAFEAQRTLQALVKAQDEVDQTPCRNALEGHLPVALPSARRLTTSRVAFPDVVALT